jgi:uncharacterized membrane protein YebE (DUF533 family)
MKMSRAERNRIVVTFGICGAVMLAVSAYDAYQEREIDATWYFIVDGWQEEYPALRPMVAEAMQDGRITNRELGRIDAAYTQAFWAEAAECSAEIKRRSLESLSKLGRK